MRTRRRPIGRDYAAAKDAECGNGEPYSGGREFGFAELKRVEVPSLPLSERSGGFDEVELCFSDEQATAETHRCLQCDLEICLAQKPADGQTD